MLVSHGRQRSTVSLRPLLWMLQPARLGSGFLYSASPSPAKLHRMASRGRFIEPSKSLLRYARGDLRKHDAGVWQKVQTLACQQPESQGRWTVRTLARKLGVPPSTVHTILETAAAPGSNLYVQSGS